MMNQMQNGARTCGPDEEKLVALYMELTGACESVARSVCAHIESAEDREPGVEDGAVEKSGESTPLPG